MLDSYVMDSVLEEIYDARYDYDYDEPWYKVPYFDD